MSGPARINARSSGASAGEKVTWIGAGVNAALILAKFAAGIFGHSHAMVADAFHSVSDFFTDAVVLLGLRFGRKDPDEGHHFGHARLETLASIVVGMALLATAITLGVQAARDVVNRTEIHPNWLALSGAGLSVLAKELLYWYTIRVGRRIRSPVVIANAKHHRSDALSSLAVMAGIIGVMLHPTWVFLDGFAALAVSFLIAKAGLDVFWDGWKEMTDSAPAPEAMEEIRACIRQVPGVLGQHDVKVRRSGGLYLMNVHIDVDGKQTVQQGHQIAKEVEQCLSAEIDNVGEVIVHVDPVWTESESTD